jgi:O-antigen/teichoic acid export membrane protein
MAAAFLPVGLQDAARYVAFGRRRPAAALASDSIWTGGFLATVAALAVAGRISAPAIVAAWALTALASLVPIWRSLSLSHRADRSTFSWRDSTGRMSATFGAEYVLLKASGQAVAYTLPWFASVEAAGGYRAASSLTNIITVLFAAVPFVLMPSLRRRITDGAIGRAEVLAWTSRVCAVLLAVTTVLGACLLLLPDQQGRFVLGDSWTDTRPVLLPMLLATASIAVWTGLLMAMRALADLRGSLTARIIQSVFVVLCSIGGAALSGARGAAFGFALGNWLGLIGWIRALRRSTGIAPDTDEGSPAAWMGQAGDP